MDSSIDEVLRPAAQSLQQPMPKEISVAWGSTLGCGARLCQQWSGACLGSPWKVVDPTLLGLFDKCHGAPGAKAGIYPGACGWYMAVLLDTPAGTWGIPQEPMGGPALQT